MLCTTTVHYHGVPRCTTTALTHSTTTTLTHSTTTVCTATPLPQVPRALSSLAGPGPQISRNGRGSKIQISRNGEAPRIQISRNEDVGVKSKIRGIRGSKMQNSRNTGEQNAEFAEYGGAKIQKLQGSRKGSSWISFSHFLQRYVENL